MVGVDEGRELRVESVDCGCELGGEGAELVAEGDAG